MIACLSSNLPNLHSTPTSPNQTTSVPDSKSQAHKLKSSPQLNRWSRARAIRSGRKLDRLGHQSTQSSANGKSSSSLNFQVRDRDGVSLEPERISDGEHNVEAMEGKSIYMVSDGTGWTAEHSVNAALGQFEHCLVDRNCAVNTHLFSGVCLSFYLLFSFIRHLDIFIMLKSIWPCLMGQVSSNALLPNHPI